MYLYRSAKHAQTSRGKELLSSSGLADVEHSLALTFAPSCWILKTPAWVCSSNFWSCAWSYKFSSESTGEQDRFVFVSKPGITWFWKSCERHVEKQAWQWLCYFYIEHTVNKFIAILSECYKNESLNNFALNIINIAFFFVFFELRRELSLVSVR